VGEDQTQAQAAMMWNGFLPQDMGWNVQGFGFEGFGGGFEGGELGMLF
jgi:hypothetical protein